jgi:hypothetical protein
MAGAAAAQDFPGFERLAVPAPHAVMEVGPPHPVRLSGMVTSRFELRSGECGAACPADTERAELSERGGGQALGQFAVSTFSLFIPRATATAPGMAVTLARFDQAGRRLLSFEWRGEGLVASGPPIGPQVLLVPANLLAGRWHDVLVEQRWSAGADGVLRIWVDGARKAAVAGNNAESSAPVSFSYGLSRGPVGAWTAARRMPLPTQVVYFSHVMRDPDRGVVDIDLRVR